MAFQSPPWEETVPRESVGGQVSSSKPHSDSASWYVYDGSEGNLTCQRELSGIHASHILGRVGSRGEGETGNPSEYKVSLRTNSDVDLARIAAVFGGGGHVKAAGCTVTGTVEEILNGVKEQIEIQWKELETV